jgi:hypothetical protein
MITKLGTFKVNDLVVFKDRAVIYKIEEITYSDWADQYKARVTKLWNSKTSHYDKDFYLEDLRLATPEEIAKAVADKMLGKSEFDLSTLNGLFKEAYADKLETLIPVPTIFGKHDKS